MEQGAQGGMRKPWLALLLAFTLFYGCIGAGGQATPTPAATASQPAVTPIAAATSTPEITPTPVATPTLAAATPTSEITPTPGTEYTPAPTRTPRGGTTLLMLGRSVNAGWAEYMGLEYGDEGYSGDYGGMHIVSRHIEPPPDLPASVDSYVAANAANADMVFFKLCFVDFSTEYGEYLQRNTGYVEHAYQTVVVRNGKKLLVGNALPSVRRDTTPGLVQNHREYNRWLEEFARTHEGVCVVDLYGTLSTPEGYLKPEYALSEEDSHLNERGYQAITPRLLEAVRECR